MSEKFNMQTQAEQLQLKYPGTGHPDLSKVEWMLTQHRDSASTYIGHNYMINTMSVAQNQSPARVRYELMQKMVAPFPGKEN